MRTLFLLAFALLFLSPCSAQAQLNDLPDSGGYGYFQDPVTTLNWMDVENFLGKSYDEVAAMLGAMGYRIATKAEVQTMHTNAGNDIFAINDATGGLSVPTMCCRQIIGWYNDQANGGNASKQGVGTILWSVTSGSTSFSYQDDAFDKSSYKDSAIGAWVVKAQGFSKYSMDFDGDGVDDNVVWRPSTGYFFVRYSNSNGYRMEQWGLPGDHPIVGDYDGDLIPDFAVWRPSSGMWYIKLSSTNFDPSNPYFAQFGLPGDRPIRADFDGDGKLDLTIWRPSEGNYYYLASSTSTIQIKQWGLPNDIPLSSATAQ